MAAEEQRIQRIVRQIVSSSLCSLWSPFYARQSGSIHEHLHGVLTEKNIYVEKLRDIYTSNCS